MTNKPTGSNPQTLDERIADETKTPLAPEFIARLIVIAKANFLTRDEVWAKWQDYSRTCDGYGQSAMVSEFCCWNKLTNPEAR